MDIQDLCMFKRINGSGGNGGSGINDDAVSSTSTWSSLKISQEMKRDYTSPSKVGDHLYEITYGTWNEAEALAYFEEKYPPFNGGCTAVRKGNKVGRNFDWHYDDIAEFIINCKAHDNVHASVGIVGNVTSITDEEAESGIWKPEYAILPYYTVDGINDAGVFIEANVVDSNDNGHTTGTNTESDHDLIAPMVIRYVLDNANSAEHAVQLLQACNIRTTTDKQEFHWMIADKTDSYEIEIVNNELKVVELDNPVVTNFFMYGWDGTAATATYNTTEWDPETTTLNEHAVGVARWDTANDGKEDSTMTIEDVMKSVKYSQYYEVNNAYDEFNGIYPDGLDLNITSESSDYADVIAAAQEAYERGERDGSIWITCHTSVYDLDANTLKVVSQEEYDGEWIERDVPVGNDGDGVSDVKVNRISVVTNGVANIDLTDIEDAIEANTIAINTKAEKSNLAYTDRIVSSLVDADKGKLFRFETDDDDAYSKNVQSGAINATLTELGGKSIVWSQCIVNGNFESDAGWKKYIKHRTNVENNEITLTVNDTQARSKIYREDLTIHGGHKYYIHCEAKASENTYDLYFSLGGSGVNVGASDVNTWTLIEGIVVPESDKTTTTIAYGDTDVHRLTDGNTMSVRNVYAVDLTQMGFNDITGTSDPRIVTIKAYATEHPEYNGGEIVNADVASVDYVGKNLLPNLKAQDTVQRVRLGEATVGNGNPFVAGTYKISVNLNSGVAGEIYWRTYKDGVSGDVNHSSIITLTENTNVKIWLYDNQQISASDVISFQVEKGSTATEYSQYHAENHPIPSAVLAQYPLRSAGSVYDTISWDSGKWWHTKKIGTVTIHESDIPSSDGYTGTFSNASGSGLWVRNLLYSGNIPEFKTKTVNGYSAMSLNGNVKINSNNFYASQYRTQFFDVASREDLIVLIGDGMDIYYELATPVVTDITDLMGTAGTDLIAMAVESGGTITFAQAEGSIFAIPNTIKYYKNVSIVNDVQMNGTSVVSGGVANIPIAYKVVKFTLSDNTEGVYTTVSCDATCEEIIAAVNDDNTIVKAIASIDGLDGITVRAEINMCGTYYNMKAVMASIPDSDINTFGKTVYLQGLDDEWTDVTE